MGRDFIKGTAGPVACTNGARAKHPRREREAGWFVAGLQRQASWELSLVLGKAGGRLVMGALFPTGEETVATERKSTTPPG